MEYLSGNIFIRAPHRPMHAGETVLGHLHNFDHTTYINKGAMEINLLEVLAVNGHGHPLQARVAESRIIRASDEVNWFLVLKGRYHVLKALEDNTVYHCIYSHRLPQAITLDQPGQRLQLPYTRRDDDGTLWIRADEKVVQDTAGWAEAYR